MKMILAALLWLSFGVGSASAQLRVLCYGDSIFACGAAGSGGSGLNACPDAPAQSSICHKMKGYRPEIALCINAVSGRTAATADAWANFNLDYCSCGASPCTTGAQVTDFVVEFGANGWTTETGLQTAQYLRSMCAKGAARGARCHIVIMPVGLFGTVSPPERVVHVEETLRELYRLNEVGPAYDIAFDVAWNGAAVSNDRLHPHIESGRAAMGRNLADHIPAVWP